MFAFNIIGELCVSQGGDVPSREGQAGHGGGQVGRQRQRYHRHGQADVHDHDGDDRLHQVSPCTFLLFSWDFALLFLCM